MSRWLVGSSSSSTPLVCIASMAKMSRERWPSDIRPMGEVCCLVLKPKVARYERHISSLRLYCGGGKVRRMKRRGVEVEHLGRVLVVETERKVLVLLDGTLGRVELAAHQLEQRGLAATVRAHQRDARVVVDSEVQILVQVVLLLA